MGLYIDKPGITSTPQDSTIHHLAKELRKNGDDIEAKHPLGNDLQL